MKAIRQLPCLAYICVHCPRLIPATIDAIVNDSALPSLATCFITATTRLSVPYPHSSPAIPATPAIPLLSYPYASRVQCKLGYIIISGHSLSSVPPPLSSHVWIWQYIIPAFIVFPFPIKWFHYVFYGGAPAQHLHGVY